MKKAISIKGERNHPYSHAIFVMKEKESPIINFVEEAEKILNKKSSPVKIIETNGIQKIIIRESSLSHVFTSLGFFVASAGLATVLIFIAIRLF